MYEIVSCVMIHTILSTEVPISNTRFSNFHLEMNAWKVLGPPIVTIEV